MPATTTVSMPRGASACRSCFWIRPAITVEERLENIIADALRSAREYVTVEDFEPCAFALVRVVVAVSHAAVVDRPQYNAPALVRELTRLVVGYVGQRRLETTQRGGSRALGVLIRKGTAKTSDPR